MRYQLTNKEFQLLELLMANPGQVISSDRLFEKIWGYESDADPELSRHCTGCGRDSDDSSGQQRPVSSSRTHRRILPNNPLKLQRPFFRRMALVVNPIQQRMHPALTQARASTGK
ncbi:MAG: winged helix-turn-helix domain-containing protein [Coprococcus sp.]